MMLRGLCAYIIFAIGLLLPADIFAAADGSSVVILFSNGKVGHIAMLVSGEEGKFTFYSINGNNIYLSPGWFQGGWYIGNSKHNDLGVGSWDTPADFMRSPFNADGPSSDTTISCCRYTDAYLIPTTAEQNDVIVECFRRMSSERYNLLKNNCATACIRSLWTAGINTEPASDAVPPAGLPEIDALQSLLDYLARFTGSYDLPYTAFRDIVTANPQGRFVDF